MKLKTYSIAALLGAGLLIANIANAQWTRVGTKTYLTNTGDNVGIGTTTPAFKLDILSTTSAASMSLKSGNGNSSIFLDKFASNNTSSVSYRTNGVNSWTTGIVGSDNYTIKNIGLNQVAIFCNYANNRVGIGMVAPANTLSVGGSADFSGNVGIGTTTPAAKLDIAGTVKITDGSQGTGKVLQSDATGKAHWAVPVASNSGNANTLVINTTNASAFTVPAGVYSITVEAVAGSGGGGGSGSAKQTGGTMFNYAISGSGGGGGGGEYGSQVVAVNPGDIIGITLGSAGVAGTGGVGANANGTVGTAGGATIVTLNGATVFTVNGGSGGQGGTFANCTGTCSSLPGSGGSGGSGSSVALEIPGTSGSYYGGGSATVFNGASIIGGKGGLAANAHNTTINGANGTAGLKGQVAISYTPASANGTIPYRPGVIIFAGAGGNLASDFNFKYDNGKLGVGTSAPSNKLSVIGNADFDGNVGIGTNSPATRLHIKGAGDQELSIESTDVGAHRWTIQSNGSSNPSSFQIIDRTAVLSRMAIDNNGNVSIGTTTPATGYKLTVAGSIICTALKVQVQPFPDYVFASDYKLNSLSEVENHIKTYNRLPGMPGACEVEDNGMDVGAMQSKVVEKVEELTLYIIQQQKQIDELKALINSQKK